MESQRPRVEAQVSAAGISCRVGGPRASPSAQCEVLIIGLKVSGVSEASTNHQLIFSGAMTKSWGQRSKVPDFTASVELYRHSGAFRDALLNRTV